MRKAVAGHPENGDLLALWLSSEKFTSLLRNHDCKATLNFVRSHFPFHGEGSCRCLHSRPRCLGRRDGQVPAYAALVRHAGEKAGDFAYGFVLRSSALSSARALASIEKWVDFLSGPKL